MVSVKTMMAYLVVILAFLAVHTDAQCASVSICNSTTCCPGPLNIPVLGSVNICCCRVTVALGATTNLCLPTSLPIPLLGSLVNVCTILGGTCSNAGK